MHFCVVGQLCSLECKNGTAWVLFSLIQFIVPIPCAQIGSSALHHAAHKGHIDLVKFLLSKGASVNLENNVGIGCIEHICIWDSLSLRCILSQHVSRTHGHAFVSDVVTTRMLLLLFFCAPNSICILVSLGPVRKNSATIGRGRKARSLRVSAPAGWGAANNWTRTHAHVHYHKHIRKAVCVHS